MSEPFHSFTDQFMPNYKSEIEKSGGLKPKMSVIENRDIVDSRDRFPFTSIPPLMYKRHELFLQ